MTRLVGSFAPKGYPAQDDTAGGAVHPRSPSLADNRQSRRAALARWQILSEEPLHAVEDQGAATGEGRFGLGDDFADDLGGGQDARNQAC